MAIHQLPKIENPKIARVLNNFLLSPLCGLLASVVMVLEQIIAGLAIAPFAGGVAATTGLGWFCIGLLGLTALSEASLRVNGRGDNLGENMTMFHGLLYAAAIHFTYYGMIEFGFKVGASAVAVGALTTTWHFVADGIQNYLAPVAKKSSDLSFAPDIDDKTEPKKGKGLTLSHGLSKTFDADNDKDSTQDSTLRTASPASVTPAATRARKQAKPLRASASANVDEELSSSTKISSRKR